MSTFDISAPFTAAELVATAEGREGTMLRICREAAAQIEEKIRARIAADGAALGKTQEEINALLANTSTAPSSLAKRERTPKTRPELPADDAAAREVLVAEVLKDRVTSKGLAGRYANGDVERVRRLLVEEAARGAASRVKMEPNGRTWAAWPRAVKP
ncbi:MAG: hypothetical protein ACM3O6_12435 [Acidobacteriota bacterium]